MGDSHVNGPVPGRSLTKEMENIHNSAAIAIDNIGFRIAKHTLARILVSSIEMCEKTRNQRHKAKSKFIPMLER